MSEFVHLHTHSEYSLLDGAARVRGIVERARALGMPAVAVTDHGVLYGAMEFSKRARQAGISPIVGCEVYVAPRHRMDRTPRVDDAQYHLTLLCQDREGYHNLTRLVSRAFLEGFYYKPRVDRELLQEHHRGLVALSGCIAGEIPSLLLAGKYDQARQVAGFYREVFDGGRFYLELQDHGLEEQKAANRELCRLSREMGIPVVASNDVHYLEREDAFIHDVLLCIQTGRLLADENRMRFPAPEFYFKSGEEMAAIFAEVPQALRNTLVIAERCALDVGGGEMYLPDFPLPAGETAESYLEKLAWSRLPERMPGAGEREKARLRHELDVITRMGFAAYFLIVQDLVSWARRHDIPVGPGRGSAAGSLVAYVLGITDLDPLRYGLLFERFLNPERVSMPDIDIDFCYEKRDRVINYLVERYGSERVAQIITFGTMAARAAIRDVGRVLDYPYHEVDRIAKMVPAELGITIDRALETSAELIAAYQNDYQVRRLIDTARALEGMPRHASVHAAGVVIGSRELASLLPLQRTSEGHVVTQYPKETVEEIGLLKMDILGLRTLTVINRALEHIRRTRGQAPQLDSLPLDDPAVYELLSSGDTIGVFQLESDGLRRLLQEMRPNCFEDLIAVIALYRPGPLGSGMVEDFINRKHGREPIRYPHLSLEPLLRETYGVILYQEQVMSIASLLGGFTMGEADILRRAMGKKKPQEIMALREQFLAGARRNGLDQATASALFDLMENFAGYGFNKSHSAAYALISYQTAYLKAHYPVEYMCAFLSSVIDHQERVVFYLKECRRLGIPILPPDINESDENFTVSEGKIRFGLGAIKNVGEAAVRAIIEARREGRFLSVMDFFRRVDPRHLNKRVLENLVLAGAFDGLGMSRRETLSVLEQCLALGAGMREAAASPQLTLFGAESVAIEDPAPAEPGEFPPAERLRREKEVLGFYVSGNPLAEYRQVLPLYITHELGQVAELEDGARVHVAGIVSAVKKHRNKKGEAWASLVLEDFSAKVAAVAFPAVFRRQGSCLQGDSAVLAEARVMKGEEGVKLALEGVAPVPAAVSALHVAIGEYLDADAGREQLLAVLARHRGEVPVYLRLPGRKVLKLDPAWWVRASVELKQELGEVCGPRNVWFA